MATINSEGKVAYIYNESNDTWYAIGGAVNTAASYTWTASQSFEAPVSLETVLNAKGGINNFQNPSARDAVITSPSNGIVAFVRQKNDGTIINQLQYYHNGEWRYIHDSMSFVTQTTSITISKDDAGKTILMDSATDITVTVPLNSTTPFVIGQKVEIVRTGSGNVTIGYADGVTINSKNSNKKIAARYSGAVLTKTDTNTWLLIGDLTA